LAGAFFEEQIRNSKIEEENGKRNSRTKSETLKQKAEDAYSVNSGPRSKIVLYV